MKKVFYFAIVILRYKESLQEYSSTRVRYIFYDFERNAKLRHLKGFGSKHNSY